MTFGLAFRFCSKWKEVSVRYGNIVITWNDSVVRNRKCLEIAYHIVLRSFLNESPLALVFAVAGLGYRYLKISFSLILGHPLRKPRLVAISSDDIFRLHKDWCANFTWFNLVLTKCTNMVARMTPGWTDTCSWSKGECGTRS
jgi:hypothetical protein